MAFCDNCGKWVKEGARFCLHCGMDQLPRRADFSAANPRPLATTPYDIPLPDAMEAAGAAAPAAPEAPAAPGLLSRMRARLQRPQPVSQPGPEPLPDEQIPLPLAEEAYSIMDIQDEEEAAAQPMPISRSPGAPVYLVQLLLMLVPLIGLVIAFIWAFTDERNIQRRDLARAVLIAYLIIALLLAALLVTLGPSVRAHLFEQQYAGGAFTPEQDGASGGDESYDEFFDQFNTAPRGSSRA